MEKFVVSTPVVNVFDVPVNNVSMEDALDVVDEAIKERRQLHIGVVNAAKIVNMGKDPVLQESVLESDFILADGMAVVWASRIIGGQSLQSRVTGIDLMFGMFERGNIKKHRVFLLGAEESVSKKVADVLASDYSGVELAGRRNGYFSEEEESEVAEYIAASNADILLVAITSPKKEIFMAKWAEKMQVPVVHGVGGSFDVMAGKVERAPEFWRNNGLEWLYRVKQEPGRLWKRYLVTNVKFSIMLLRFLLGRILRKR